MRAAYLIVGNIWLLFAVLLAVGKQVMRTSPDRYGFFGHGWMTPAGYSSAVIFCLVIGALCIYASSRKT